MSDNTDNPSRSTHQNPLFYMLSTHAHLVYCFYSTEIIDSNGNEILQSD